VDGGTADGVLSAAETCAPLCRNPRCRKPRKRRPSGFLEGARDLCRACYDRARDAGFPDVIPAPVPRSRRGAAARDRATAGREERIARLASLLGRRYPFPVAARMTGVKAGTAYKYMAELRRRQREQQEAA
jgi:hypothetical protein